MPAKIGVFYYSTWQHVQTLCEEAAAAAKEAGAEVEILQIAETLSEEILAKMHAPPKADYPVAKPDDLTKYDGYIFGIPTRYGRAPAQVSTFFDATGGLWAKGALTGKFATVIAGTGSSHGGQETTALTTYPFFVHHGINIVPAGFGAPELSDNTEVVGGSAYGAASISNGDGSRGVSDKEKAIARYQGKHFATTVKTFVAGKESLAGLKI